MKDFASGCAPLIVVVAIIVIVVLLMDAAGDIGKEKGACAVLGGTYVSSGIQIDSTKVYCIEKPTPIPLGKE